ncbi:MAG: hypothetical protein WC227_00365 [Patescibacteria group bacterium]|jgi:hypothetical protein
MNEKKTISKLTKGIDSPALLDYATEEHGEYWRGHEDRLDHLIKTVVLEIESLDQAASKPIQFDHEKPKTYKAIWAISGAGTYQESITDLTGDAIYKDKTWAHNSDKKRIDHAIKIIREISLAVSGLSEEDQKSLTEEQVENIIREFGPYLIYNGVKIQIEALRSAVRIGKLNFPEEKLCIPDGTITCTIDQVTDLKFPNIEFNIGDIIGVVTHSPHFPRVLRMANKHKSFPRGATIQAFPIKLDHLEDEIEFTNAELRGIIGYISKDHAEFAPYSYII